MRSVLVIGASGILAPAVGTLRSRGKAVVAVGRSRQRLEALGAEQPIASAGMHPLAADATDLSFPRTLEDYLEENSLTLSAAALYMPATTAAVAARLPSLVAGPVIEILTSGVASPTEGGCHWSINHLAKANPATARLVLGWHKESGSTRWHTAGEVSAAVVNMLADPRDRILGTVAPWNERP